MDKIFDELIIPVEEFSFLKTPNCYPEYINRSHDFKITALIIDGQMQYYYRLLDSTIQNRLKLFNIESSQKFSSLHSCKKAALNSLKKVMHKIEFKLVDPSISSCIEHMYDPCLPYYDHYINVLRLKGNTGNWKFSVSQSVYGHSLGLEGEFLNTPFKTRREVIQNLRENLVHSLPHVYNSIEQNAFKQLIQTSTNKHLIVPGMYWWCYFIRPEVDLDKIF